MATAPTSPASLPAVRLDGTCLRLSGRLDRAAATALWPQASAALAGVQSLDVGAVQGLDSAGVALLVALAERLRQAGADPRVAGAPAGLADLLAAYRLTPALSFDLGQ